jgi:hypothetical protein
MKDRGKGAKGGAKKGRKGDEFAKKGRTTTKKTKIVI